MNSPVRPLYRRTAFVVLLLTYRFPSGPAARPPGRINPPAPDGRNSPRNSPLHSSKRNTLLVRLLPTSTSPRAAGTRFSKTRERAFAITHRFEPFLVPPSFSNVNDFCDRDLT